MIRVTLDLSCSICGHEQFYLPINSQEGTNVRCANCSAFKCKTLDLEKALSAIQRTRSIDRPVAA
ncbi:hypothetical protein BC443_04015 [Salinicola sp. MIT1003]|jgi:DNA-directed RNA polymerase subunit RPC12/RpoP|uniref:hypothetical protein n=1 Tax=Salinicola salarius TaxID=430457 RepID=UPI0008DD4091|nr:hypothetical protein [Salinicola salarius]OHY98239.1 hypothetical protein BC443_04015 [Salinicola sp. MIT1003]|tara:strand:- start:182 stop:376 length:195 start_codon:yes stop_codon:yes gene_type:complete